MVPNWSLQRVLDILLSLSHRFQIEVPTTIRSLARDLTHAGVTLPLQQVLLASSYSNVFVPPSPPSPAIHNPSVAITLRKVTLSVLNLFHSTPSTSVSVPTLPSLLESDDGDVADQDRQSLFSPTVQLPEDARRPPLDMMKHSGTSVYTSSQLFSAISLLPALDVVCAVFANSFELEVSKAEHFFHQQLSSVESRWEKIKVGCALLQDPGSDEIALKRYSDIHHILVTGMEEIYALVYHLINFCVGRRVSFFVRRLFIIFIF